MCTNQFHCIYMAIARATPVITSKRVATDARVDINWQYLSVPVCLAIKVSSNQPINSVALLPPERQFPLNDTQSICCCKEHPTIDSFLFLRAFFLSFLFYLFIPTNQFNFDSTIFLDCSIIFFHLF